MDKTVELDLDGITFELNRSPYGYFLHAAKWIRRLPEPEGGSDRQQVIYQRMMSMTFLAFALEAFFNYLAAKQYSIWNDVEKKLQFEEKFSMLSRDLKVDFPRGQRPYQSYKLLKDLRNDFAHGKPKLVSGKLNEFEEVARLDFEKKFFEADLDTIEKDVEEIIKAFWGKCSYEGAEHIDPLEVPEFL